MYINKISYEIIYILYRYSKIKIFSYAICVENKDYYRKNSSYKIYLLAIESIEIKKSNYRHVNNQYNRENFKP